MANKRPIELTPAQLAKQEARRLKKLIKPTQPTANQSQTIVQRAWIPADASETQGQRIKVLTWNLLAQCLIRRKLFPTSDCLKAKERQGMTFSEMFTHSPDIMCLQEVDRLEKIIPALENASYSHYYIAGPRKKHGCMIAFKSSLYTKVGERLVQYDNENVRDDGSEAAQRGSSFRTRNIGSIVALQDANNAERGVLVATTHLFWHPRYNYERARQVGILKRAVLQYRTEQGLDHWPCIIAGDFNFSPDDPAYALLVGDTLSPLQEEQIHESHVVHLSIDPSVPKTVAPSVPAVKPVVLEDEKVTAEETTDVPADEDATEDAEAEREADEASDPRMPITSARKAVPTDGLLSPAELQAFFSASGPPLRSAYDLGLRNIASSSLKVRSFHDRVPLPPSQLGAFEPEWTSYTHYWKTVLDYIFIVEPKATTRPVVVAGLLQPHRTEDLVLGLPQSGICGSDHVSLCAEVVFPKDV